MKYNENDFEHIYKEHNLLVRKFLYRYRGKEELDEIVQDVFLKVFNGLEDFNQNSSLKTWIIKIAINTSKNHYRSKLRKWGRLILSDKIQDYQSPKDIENEIASKQACLRMINQLSEKLRDVIILYSIEEFSIEEIGDILKIPEGTVKSRISLAKQKLKDFLKDEEGYEQRSI